MFHLRRTFLIAIIFSLVPSSAHSKNNSQRDVFAPRQVIVTSGWEKQLVEADPNLKQWNWSAMYSVVGRPRTNPLPYVDHRRREFGKAKSFYSKPSQAAIPKNILAEMARQRGLPMTTNEHESNRQATSSTSLKFSTKRTSATLTYGQSYQSSKVPPKFDGGQQSSIGTVHGKLLSSGI